MFAVGTRVDNISMCAIVLRMQYLAFVHAPHDITSTCNCTSINDLTIITISKCIGKESALQQRHTQQHHKRHHQQLHQYHNQQATVNVPRDFVQLTSRVQITKNIS